MLPDAIRLFKSNVPRKISDNPLIVISISGFEWLFSKKGLELSFVLRIYVLH